MKNLSVDNLLIALCNVGRICMSAAVECFLWFLVAGLGWLVGLLPSAIPAFLWWLTKTFLVVGATAFIVVLAILGWRRYGDQFMYWLAGKIDKSKRPLPEANYSDWANTIMHAKLPSNAK